MRRAHLRAMPAVASALLLAVNVGLSGAGAPTPAAVNVRVSHDHYSAHAQPTLAVNPRNTLNLLGAAMAIGGGSLVEETFASFDGGGTWRDNGPLPLPSGVTFGGDPSAAFDARGIGYVVSLAEPQEGDGVFLWRTDDGGRSFKPAVAIEHGQAADHPWLAIEPSATLGGGDLYVAWATRDIDGLGHRGGLAFSRSTDGGRSFSVPRIIAAPAGGVSIPTIAAGPLGAVYVAFTAARPDVATSGSGSSAAMRTGVNNERLVTVASHDHGRTFTPPTLAAMTSTLLAAEPGVALTTQPSVAINDRNGTVYVAFSAFRGAGRRAGIYVTRSRDGGRTWGSPISVTNASAAAAPVYFQPHIVIDASGNVDVTYFALVSGMVNLVLAQATNRDPGFTSVLRVTSRPFNPVLGWSGQKTGQWWIGDYQGLAVSGGIIHPFWNDTRTGQLEIFTAAIPLNSRQWSNY